VETWRAWAADRRGVKAGNAVGGRSRSPVPIAGSDRRPRSTVPIDGLARRREKPPQPGGSFPMSDPHFFNLHDLSQGIRRRLAEGLETRIFPGENVMLSVVRVAPNAASEVHSHPQEQWGVLLEGSGVRIQEGIAHAVTAGDFWQTPGNVPHGFTAGAEGAVVLDVFSPPRDEYRRPGAGVR
jgi:quercetin dioxygenase-like cupin family protein